MVDTTVQLNETLAEIRRRLAVSIYEALASSSIDGKPLILPSMDYKGSGEVVIDGYFDLSAVASKLLENSVLKGGPS